MMRPTLPLALLVACASPPQPPADVALPPEPPRRQVEPPALEQSSDQDQPRVPDRPAHLVATGDRFVPSDLVWTGSEFLLAYYTSPLSGSGTMYLARIAPDGSLLGTEKLGVGSHPRLAISDVQIGITFGDPRPTWRVLFSRADLTGKPVAKSEILLDDVESDHSCIAWNPEAREWAVGWRTYDDRSRGVSTLRLTRISRRGKLLADTKLDGATLAPGTSVVTDVVGSGRSYRMLVGLPLTEIRLDGKEAVPGKPLFAGRIRHLRLARDNDDVVAAFVERDNRTLRVARIADGRASKETQVYLSTDTGLPEEPIWARHRGRQIVFWRENISATEGNRLYYAYVNTPTPQRLDAREIGQQLVFVAWSPEQLAVAYQTGFGGTGPEIYVKIFD